LFGKGSDAVIESKIQSEIVMFVPHLEHGDDDEGSSKRPMKFTFDENTPVIGMYKQELQGWQSARITSISKQEITFLLEDTQGPSGPIRIVVAAEAGKVPFRAVCTGRVVRVVQNPELGNAVQVCAHIQRWEFIKPKGRRGPFLVR
jgi:hypothetical protein